MRALEIVLDVGLGRRGGMRISAGRRPGSWKSPRSCSEWSTPWPGGYAAKLDQAERAGPWPANAADGDEARTVAWRQRLGPARGLDRIDISGLVPSSH
jgi:hypothetical protein